MTLPQKQPLIGVAPGFLCIGQLRQFQFVSLPTTASILKDCEDSSLCFKSEVESFKLTLSEGRTTIFRPQGIQCSLQSVPLCLQLGELCLGIGNKFSGHTSFGRRPCAGSFWHPPFRRRDAGRTHPRQVIPAPTPPSTPAIRRWPFTRRNLVHPNHAINDSLS